MRGGGPRCGGRNAAGVRTIEYRFLHADGKYRWIRLYRRVLPACRGRPRQIIGVGLDITDLKRSEDLLRNYLDLAPFAMLIVNRSGEIGYANTRAEALFGYTREKMLGRDIEMLVPEHRRE